MRAGRSALEAALADSSCNDRAGMYPDADAQRLVPPLHVRLRVGGCYG